MNNRDAKKRESAYQKACRALDFLFVEGLRNTRENAEVWQEWIELRAGLTSSLFASLALVPMLLVTYVIGEHYRHQMGEFRDLVLVILVEAVICGGVLMHTLMNFIRCSAFKGRLLFKGLL